MDSWEYDWIRLGAYVSIQLGRDNWLIRRSRRGVFQGYANILFGAGAGYVADHSTEKLMSRLGAPMGGLINDTLGWRWAFYLQVSPSHRTI